MRWGDFFAARQIRNRSRDFEDAVERTRAQLQLLHRRAHERLPGRVELTEYAHIGGAVFRTDHVLYTFGESRFKAEIALINRFFGFVIISRVIGAGHHAGFASNTFLIIHHDNAVDFVFISCFCGASPHAGRIVALVAKDGYKIPFLIDGFGDFPF